MARSADTFRLRVGVRRGSRSAYTRDESMLSLPSPKTALKFGAAWVASNVAWALLSGAAGAIASAILKAGGVLDNAYGLVAIGLVIAALVASLPAVARQLRDGGRPRGPRLATVPTEARIRRLYILIGLSPAFWRASLNALRIERSLTGPSRSSLANTKSSFSVA